MNILEKTVEINKSLAKEKLVMFTWGNASVFDPEVGIVYIKPSGVPFGDLKESDVSQIKVETGELIDGLKPSVDTPTHLELFRSFKGVRSVIHTHSKYCTIFAQAKMDIPCLGTTHADYFYGGVPLVPALTEQEIIHDYEANTGKRITQHFNDRHISPLQVKAALCPSHGVFVWGETADEALSNAIILENVAEMAYKTIMMCYSAGDHITFDMNLLRKHFLRKHGEGSYYGQ